MALPATGTATRDGSCCCGGPCGGCACSPQPAGIDIDLSGLTLHYGFDSSCTFDGLVLSLASSEAQPCTWSTDGDVPTDMCPLGSPCSDDPLFARIAFTFECPGSLVLNIQFAEATTGCNFFFSKTVTLDDAADRAAAGVDCDPFAATLSGFTATNLSGPGACLCAGTISLSGSVSLSESAGPMTAAAAAVAAVDPGPCRWRGVELTGPERAALALDHRKTWYLCGKPDFPRLGLPVTDCRTCKAVDMRCSKAGCTGYEPADVDGRPGV